MFLIIHWFIIFTQQQIHKDQQHQKFLNEQNESIEKTWSDAEYEFFSSSHFVQNEDFGCFLFGDDALFTFLSL